MVLELIRVWLDATDGALVGVAAEVAARLPVEVAARLPDVSEKSGNCSGSGVGSCRAGEGPCPGGGREGTLSVCEMVISAITLPAMYPVYRQILYPSDHLSKKKCIVWERSILAQVPEILEHESPARRKPIVSSMPARGWHIEFRRTNNVRSVWMQVGV